MSVFVKATHTEFLLILGDSLSLRIRNLLAAMALRGLTQ